MNHTIAKIRQREGGTKYRKIFSGQEIFNLSDEIPSFVNYDPNHNLDEDSWFGLEDFSEQEYCIDILKQNFISSEYDTILKRKEANKIDFIFTYYSNGTYCFQNVTKSQLSKKRYIKLGDEYSFIKDSQDITINQVPDAIYLKVPDILHFKKLSSISKIFPGISELFREATHEETEVFLENDFISLKNNFKAESVRQSNRKRIALSIEKLNSYSEEQKKAVFDNIRHYYPNLINKKGAFEVSNDNELKLLLYGIDQRFYTTADGTEKRIANSIIKI